MFLTFHAVGGRATLYSYLLLIIVICHERLTVGDFVGQDFENEHAAFGATAVPARDDVPSCAESGSAEIFLISGGSRP